MNNSRRFSAYIEDMSLGDLPKAVRDDIGRFISATVRTKVIHFGMVVKELISKADPANLKTARAHVKDTNPDSARKLVNLQVRKGTKFILLLNDRIIDGHHFLALAERGGVSSSLNVLDLTPTRFQFAMKPTPLTGSIFELAKKTLSPEAVAGISGGVTGAGLAGVLGGIKRGTTFRGVAKSAGTAGLASAALLAGGVAIGRRVLGNPKKNEANAYTKRAAVGGSIGGAVAGGLGGLALLKTRRGARKLVEASKTLRPAQWIRKSGALGGTAVGAGLGGLYGGYQGADEGTAVDAINSAAKQPPKRQHRLAAKVHRLIQFEDDLVLKGKLAPDRYRKKIQDDDLDRRDGNVKRAAILGAAAGALLRGSTLGTGARAAIGGTGAAAGVLAIRQGTESGKDLYGERSRAGKNAEGFPAGAALGAAGLLAYRRLVGKVRKFQANIIAVHYFRGPDQILTDSGTMKGMYANPLKVASGEQIGYTRDRHGNQTAANVGFRHAQVLRAALNKGREVQKVGRRAGSLTRDVVDSVAGRPKTDERGRPLKKEWEKSWFRNAAGSAVAGAGLLAHAVAVKRSPRYRAGVTKVVGGAKAKANALVPGLFLAAKVKAICFSRRSRLLQFDSWAEANGWDVRDPRGRSARVFAPGARARTRRGKEWHEKSSNQRLILGGLAVAGTLAGAAIGYKLGRPRVPKFPTVPGETVVDARKLFRPDAS